MNDPTDLMRVAVFTDAPELWGAEHTLVDLMSRAHEHGFAATIFAPAGSPIHSHPRLRSHTSVVEMPGHPALEKGGIRNATPLDLCREVAVRARGARVISERLNGYDAALSFRLWRNEEVISAAHRKRIPAVVDLHETFQGRLGRILSSVSLRRADAVIAPSDFVAVSGGAPLKRTTIVPRAVAFDLPERLDKRSDALIVGMFGQLRAHKGHTIALRAIQLASRDIPVELIVAGAGGDDQTRRELERAQRSFPSLIKIIPPIDNPLSLMAGCHVIVNASTHEAFGRTVIEGMAAGCLPIVTGSGPAEIVRDSGIGLVTADRSAESLAHQLVSVWRDQTALLDATANGPRVVRERYSLETVSRRYFAALRLAVQRRPGRGTAQR